MRPATGPQVKNKECLHRYRYTICQRKYIYPLDAFLEQNQQYQLGAWKVCPQTNSLTNQVDTRSIDNKSMLVLLFLMQHAGQEVTKGQIYQHVWKDSFVADDILSVAVSKIRKALGDNARSPTYIKTLPGVGYRLIANVEIITAREQQKNEQPLSSGLAKLATSKPSIFKSGISKPNSYVGIISLLFFIVALTLYISTDETSPAAQLNINSIAVLPFNDLSAEQNNQHFTDGLPDAIINQLSQTNALKVISRYSSFTYRGNYNAAKVGQALQVEALLDGSVQKIGQQLRITVSIFSTSDGQQLWSKTFDSDSQDIFKLQDNISADIHALIRPGDQQSDDKPSAKAATKISAQAYEWYLMGQYHWRQRNPKSLAKAVTYFNHSLELAPDYADAHIGLAITYANLHHFANWSEAKAIEKSFPHIEKALLLKPNSPTALAAHGMLLTLKSHYENAFADASSTLVQRAKQNFLRSLALDDNATTHRWYSKLLTRLGNESKVIQHMNQAIALNPLSGSLKRSLSKYLRSIGKTDSAQRMYQRALILEPDHFSHAIESTHIFRHEQKSIIALAQWHSTNAELFTNCSSDEYCEQLVLAYLSIGANEVANQVLTNMGGKHGHFLNSLDLINFAAKGEEQNILSIKERIAFYRPNNRRALYELAVAQFRTDKFQSAKITLLKAYPQWRKPEAIELSDISADNHTALLLYAVTLLNLDEKQAANTLLDNIQTLLKQDKVFDKIQTEFVLAEINAQLNNTPQALEYLETALNMGWLEYYDREWWSLQNNHFLAPLHKAPQFQLLLEQHQEKLGELRDKVARKLNTRPSSM